MHKNFHYPNSATTLIKAKKYIPHITLSITQMAQQLNIQSSGQNLWNYLTWLVVLIEENFPHDLLVANILKNAAPELFIFTNNSVKHKKTKIKVCLETLLKNSLSWNTVSWGNLSWFLSFLSPPLTPCYNSSARFPELVRPAFLLLDNFLCCPCDHSMQYFDKHTVC